MALAIAEAALDAGVVTSLAGDDIAQRLWARAQQRPVPRVEGLQQQIRLRPRHGQWIE